MGLFKPYEKSNWYPYIRMKNGKAISREWATLQGDKLLMTPVRGDYDENCPDSYRQPRIVTYVSTVSTELKMGDWTLATSRIKDEQEALKEMLHYIKGLEEAAIPVTDDVTKPDKADIAFAIFMNKSSWGNTLKAVEINPIVAYELEEEIQVGVHYSDDDIPGKPIKATLVIKGQEIASKNLEFSMGSWGDNYNTPDPFIEFITEELALPVIPDSIWWEEYPYFAAFPPQQENGNWELAVILDDAALDLEKRTDMSIHYDSDDTHIQISLKIDGESIYKEEFSNELTIDSILNDFLSKLTAANIQINPSNDAMPIFLRHKTEDSETIYRGQIDLNTLEISDVKPINSMLEKILSKYRDMITFTIDETGEKVKVVASSNRNTLLMSSEADSIEGVFGRVKFEALYSFLSYYHGDQKRSVQDSSTLATLAERMKPGDIKSHEPKTESKEIS